MKAKTLYYPAGFALSRAVEYPMQVLSAFVYAQLLRMFQLQQSQELLSNFREATQQLWFVYKRDLQDWFVWGVWIGVGVLLGIGASLAERLRGSVKKIFWRFYVVIVFLCLYGVHIWQFGWRYESSYLLLLYALLSLLGQFMFGFLLVSLLPRVYCFLAETRVEDWLARLRSRA